MQDEERAKSDEGKPNDAESRSIFDWLVLALATGFFLGFARPRTATWGTLLGIPLALALYGVFGWTGYLPVLLALWLVGVPICQRGAELIGHKDPREVTYDEYSSLPLVYFYATDFGWQSWQILIAGFALHRFFDILKPLGIDGLQRLKGGWGIIVDDIVASIYALGVMHLLYYFQVL